FTLWESLPLMQGFRRPNHRLYCSSENFSSFHRKKSACVLFEEPRMFAWETSFSLKSVSVWGLMLSMPPYSSYGIQMKKRSAKVPSPPSSRQVSQKSTDTSFRRN